jgi:hypothetical protein
MDHPDGAMLDEVMGSLCQNWIKQNSARYTTLSRSGRSRCRGIITSSTGVSLAAFKMIGCTQQGFGQDTFIEFSVSVGILSV